MAKTPTKRVNRAATEKRNDEAVPRVTRLGHSESRNSREAAHGTKEWSPREMERAEEGCEWRHGAALVEERGGDGVAGWRSQGEMRRRYRGVGRGVAREIEKEREGVEGTGWCKRKGEKGL